MTFDCLSSRFVKESWFYDSIRLMIPPSVQVKDGRLPDNPGVYFYYGDGGKLLYVGKATSLKRRVATYFSERGDGRGARIAELVSKIARIDYVETPTVIEALVLEANQIKAHAPPYNVLGRDDKSFNYLVITNEEFPRPLLMRGLDLERLGVNPFDKALTPATKKKFLAVFGPYTSGLALKRALALIRPSIPWSTCAPGQKRSCFDRQLGKCPGVCVGEISKAEYRKTVRNLILFFEGKKTAIVRTLKRDMARAAAALDFERAAKLRGQVFALEHIRDVSLIMREDVDLPFAPVRDAGYLDLNGRVEAYDISNISGTSAVGSMVVFEEGKPAKALYRKFRIKTVKGANDFAMMEEVLRRRLSREAAGSKGWGLPALMVIDGGEGQVGRVLRVMDGFGVRVPVVGIAKGFDRKQDRLVYDRTDTELHRAVMRGKEILQRARDEAHRFAVSYHRTLRSKRS
ncbi:hypothetical protein A2304_05465, partial [Candidatus Uhrbacteria bacterium RIFOXYB2_FULL_57_15]